MENITFAYVLAIVVSALTSSIITSWWLHKRRQRPLNNASSLPPVPDTITSIKTEASRPAIVTHAADGILTFDKTNLLIRMMNPAAEKLFGVQEASMLGQPICTLVGTRMEDPGEDPTPAYRSLIERAVAANYPYDMMGYAQNRAMFPVEIAIVEMQDENEPLYLATVRDGSRRQLAEAARRDSEQKYRQLVRHMQDGVFILQDGRLPFVNQALADMLGYSVAELTGRHYTALLAPEEHERVARYYDEALAEETAPVDVELCLQGREETHRIIANMKTTLVNYNGRSAHMGTVVNITARKQYETDLKLAKETAESASRSKSAFLANMSHELRTPLNAIIGYSEMLEEDAIDLEQTEFVPDLQKIRKAGRHLLELINGILDLSKIEAGKMDIYIEPFAVDELINDVVETIDPLIKKRGNRLVLTGDRSGTMQADKTKVRQTLFNLLTNASKFTENGTITLETSCEDMGSEGEWIQFRV
ncbi:MAG: PAS domain S-box protein, partial [Anaerolineales bacterium]|nr:PAS domain S-box protein [Anaerolineales bacterium]